MPDTPLTPQIPASTPAGTPPAPAQQQAQPARTPPAPLSADPIKYLESLFDMMIKYDSSDIYLTYGEEPTLRIFGEARRLQGVAKLDDQTLNAVANYMMTEEDKKNYDTNLACDIGISMHGRRYRVNISRQRDHIMIVARLLEEKVPTIDDRKLPQIFKQLTQKTNGVIFVAGPTGSGKSTTLAAMIEEINMTKPKHIITIEDPIEYVFEPKKSIFEQKQLGKDIVSFSGAMKYALRQRPDVILFGEIRDTESVRNAIALAETGHLVMTTIHSRSAEQSVNKIISMFPADEQPQIRNQLSENMTAIIIQKLVRKADGKGMVPAHEILLNNTAVENTIRENKLNQLKNVMYTNRNIGMQLLEDNLATLAEQGLITPEQAMANANDHDHVKRELQTKGFQI
ncbi:MAG: PilT/PilU family type 4a pilus ATPase [Candidatus Peribacteria bacterium]|jgi:twitching motility protein PilT|nr:PilT/PilU family type 4a pilus ATPase [Candidatus Peribacteria bacterium]